MYYIVRKEKGSTVCWVPYDTGLSGYKYKLICNKCRGDSFCMAIICTACEDHQESARYVAVNPRWKWTPSI